LYNFHEKLIKWETALGAGDLIKFSGNPKIPVLAVSADSTSQLLFGKRERIIRDNSIQDQTTARKRASSEIKTYANEMSEISFFTYTAGLRAGMMITLDSTLRDVSKSYIIRRVLFKPIDKDNFGYEVELASAKTYELNDLLQKILKIDTNPDPNELAEFIETDIMDITITELIQAIEMYDDEVEIVITELIEDDPLGAGVEPTFVLGYYFPTSITDTKRQGLLDRSLYLY